MFTVTPSAALELMAAAERSDAIGMALRVAARQTPDGSIEYGMGFDEQRVEDQPADFGGLTVLLGPPSQALLAETVLDYVEVEPGQHSFVFIPPPEAPAASFRSGAAKGGCGGGGCGGGGCGGGGGGGGSSSSSSSSHGGHCG